MLNLGAHVAYLQLQVDALKTVIADVSPRNAPESIGDLIKSFVHTTGQRVMRNGERVAEYKFSWPIMLPTWLRIEKDFYGESNEQLWLICPHDFEHETIAQV